MKIPGGWTGSCTNGEMKPSFSLVPKNVKSNLGVPVYDDLARKKKNLIVGTQNWNNEIWTPQKIIGTYGPAGTWAQDGSWGYRNPAYMLNQIIWL